MRGSEPREKQAIRAVITDKKAGNNEKQGKGTLNYRAMQS